MVSSWPTPDFCRLRDALQTAVEAFALLRHQQRERALLDSSAARLRAVVGQVESFVADPTQRYDFPQEQQWGFVGLVAYVQEAKEELKWAQRRQREKPDTAPLPSASPIVELETPPK